MNSIYNWMTHTSGTEHIALEDGRSLCGMTVKRSDRTPVRYCKMCLAVGGRGQVDVRGAPRSARICPTCGGEGVRSPVSGVALRNIIAGHRLPPCETCGGTGRIRKQEGA